LKFDLKLKLNEPLERAQELEIVKPMIIHSPQCENDKLTEKCQLHLQIMTSLAERPA
jgi:hypothetical protein